MRGWEADDVIDRLESSPLYAKRIFWLQDLSDGAVSWLYTRCHMALYPSLYEGWGLPVVEALQHRRPVIASNRGAVPEAGLGIAQIIDPDDLTAWCEAVTASDRAPRAETPQIPLPSWDESAATIRSILLAGTFTSGKITA
jgi:glycosyltransferase involved in cell wall biosynthesis